MAAAPSYPAGVLVEECAGLVGAPYPAGVLVGTSDLRCLGLVRCLFGSRPRLSAPLHHLDRCSDSCCLDGDFSLAVV